MPSGARTVPSCGTSDADDQALMLGRKPARHERQHNHEARPGDTEEQGIEEEER